MSPENEPGSTADAVRRERRHGIIELSCAHHPCQFSKHVGCHPSRYSSELAYCHPVWKSASRSDSDRSARSCAFTDQFRPEDTIVVGRVTFGAFGAVRRGVPVHVRRDPLVGAVFRGRLHRRARHQDQSGAEEEAIRLHVTVLIGFADLDDLDGHVLGAKIFSVPEES
jgi:hypothetical protein